MKFRKTAASILAAAMAFSAVSVCAFAEEQAKDEKIELISAEIPAELKTSIVFIEGTGLVDITGATFDSSENGYADENANLDVDFDGLGYVSKANLEAWRETGVLTFSKLKADFDTTGLQWGMFSHGSEYVQLVRKDGDEVTERGLYKVTDGEIKKLCDLDTFWTCTREDGVSVGFESIYDTIHYREETGENGLSFDEKALLELKMVVTQPDGTKTETVVFKSNITDVNITIKTNEDYEKIRELYYSDRINYFVSKSGDKLASVGFNRKPIMNLLNELYGGWSYEILEYYADGTSKEIYSEESTDSANYWDANFEGVRPFDSGDVMWWDFTPPKASALTMHRYNAETGEIETFGAENGDAWFTDDSDSWYDWTIDPKFSIGNVLVADINVYDSVYNEQTDNVDMISVVDGYAFFTSLKDLDNWRTKTYYKKITAVNVGKDGEKKYIFKYETKDGKVGYMDENEKVLGEFDAVGGFAGKYAPAVKNGKAFLIDKDMNVVSGELDADGVVAVNDDIFIISNGEKSYFVTSAAEKSDNPPTEAVIVDYSDETTGIKASAEEGVVEDGAKLTVEAVADKTNENTFTYNICFKKGEEEVQPNGKVTVKIPVPEAIKDKTIYVYRVEEDGKYTDMNAKVEDGFVVFETDHFSEYVVTSEKHSENPNTGYAGISLALIALAGASVVVFRKKNR